MRYQLLSKNPIQYGLRGINRHLSIKAFYWPLAQVERGFQTKAVCAWNGASLRLRPLHEQWKILRRSIRHTAIAALSTLATTAAIAQTADFPASLACAKSETSQACAARFQVSLEAAQPGLVKRTATGLRVRLDDGKFNVISRKCADCLDAIALHAPTRWLLVRERLPIGHKWILLRLTNGKQTALRGFPTFSPDAKSVFVWSGLDASGSMQPTAEIFAINDGALQSRWKGVTGLQTKTSFEPFYGVAEPKWKTSDSLEFVKNKWRDTASKSEYAASRVTLTKSKEDWIWAESAIQ